MQVPDPNTFGGPVKLFRREWGYVYEHNPEWREMPLAFGYTENSRSFGAADMAMALKNNRPFSDLRGDRLIAVSAFLL